MADPIDLPSSLPDEDGPLVSVVMGSYEAERGHLSAALESVARQTYSNVEVVIVDSSRLEYIAATAAATDWIRHVPQDPLGVSVGFNAALDHATGDVIAILADDDQFEPRRIERTLYKLEHGADVVYSDCYDLDDETGETNYRTAMQPDELDDLWVKLFRFDGQDGSIPAATVSFRAECVANERFDPDLRGGEDYHLWVRLFREFEPAYIPEPLATMRQHDDSLSSDPDLMYENRMQAIAKLCERYPELREYRAERELIERYDYGRQLLRNGRRSAARSVFLEVLREERYLRAAVMVGVSLLPLDPDQTLDLLDGLRDRVV